MLVSMFTSHILGHIFSIMRLVMLVKEDPLLVDVVAMEKCHRVMDLLCEQCVKQQDMNEVLAMRAADVPGLPAGT